MWGGVPRQLWLGLVIRYRRKLLLAERRSVILSQLEAPGEPNNGAAFSRMKMSRCGIRRQDFYSTWTDSPIDQSHFPIIEVVLSPSAFALATLAFGPPPPPSANRLIRPSPSIKHCAKHLFICRSRTLRRRHPVLRRSELAIRTLRCLTVSRIRANSSTRNG